MNNNKPYVSVIVPCRNEEKFIGNCLDSIVAQDYPKKTLEVLVVDGMSEDGTRQIVKRYGRQCPFISLLENPKIITPCALNIGVKHAKGQIIMIMSAHATCKEDYISRCVNYLGEYNADNVGGVMLPLPRNNTFVGKAIVFALSCPFGVGNSNFRIGSKRPRWVDTVLGGCYKKEVFGKLGLFNEKLVYSQDMEFNLRLKKADGKILLVPEIMSYYYARSDFKSFLRHNFRNGVWAIYPFKYSKMPVSWRHLVPLVFVSGLIGSATLSFFFPIFLWLFLFVLSSYSLINFYFSCKMTLRQNNFRYLFIVPIIFATFHIGYGMGSIWGAIKLLKR